MEPLMRATDPGSDRLTRGQVIEIHKAHRQGIPWKQIAEDFDTTQKNVSRIVQGYRWRSVHPNAAPELYTDAAPDDLLQIANALEVLNEIERQVFELRSIIGQLVSREE